MNLTLNRAGAGEPWNFRLENTTDAISDVRLSKEGVRLIDAPVWPGVIEVSSGQRGAIPGFAVVSYTLNGSRVKRCFTFGGPANALVAQEYDSKVSP